MRNPIGWLRFAAFLVLLAASSLSAFADDGFIRPKASGDPSIDGSWIVSNSPCLRNAAVLTETPCNGCAVLRAFYRIGNTRVPNWIGNHWPDRLNWIGDRQWINADAAWFECTPQERAADRQMRFEAAFGECVRSTPSDEGECRVAAEAKVRRDLERSAK